MNNKVQDFIELWRDKRSLNTLMDSDLKASDAQELRSELKNMNPEQRVEAEGVLKDVSELLVERIKALNEKRAQIHKEMKRSKKTKSACLAYQRQGGNSPGYKEAAAEHLAHKTAKVQEREELLRESLEKIDKNTK